MVARSCPEHARLWGLLHDASEAYLSDLVSPVKRHLRDYVMTEGVLLRAICVRFGLTWPAPQVVKARDKQVGELERVSLIHGQGNTETHGNVFAEQHWSATRDEFLRFYEKYKVESAEALRLLGIAKWRNTKVDHGQIEMRHPNLDWIIRFHHPRRTVSEETSRAVTKALREHFAEAQHR